MPKVRKKITSVDVAEAAGVSQSTVSRVMRGDRRISLETRLHVANVAHELGYRSADATRAIASQKSQIIGAVVSDMQNPFYAALLTLLHDMLELQGYRTLLFTERTDSEASLERLNRMTAGVVDGLICATAMNGPRSVEFLESSPFPVVAIIRHVEGARVDSVVVDNVAGGRLAGEHLLELGHERIGIILGPPQTSTAQEREIGFRIALGNRFDLGLRRSGSYSYQTGYQHGRDLLQSKSPPTAIFCTNDIVAFGALDAAHRLGVQVPEQLSILGFDDIAMAGWSQFNLTTIRQPVDEMARAAVRRLLERVEGQHVDRDPRQEVFPVSFVKRESTAPPPARASAGTGSTAEARLV